MYQQVSYHLATTEGVIVRSNSVSPFHDACSFYEEHAIPVVVIRRTTTIYSDGDYSDVDAKVGSMSARGLEGEG